MAVTVGGGGGGRAFEEYDDLLEKAPIRKCRIFICSCLNQQQSFFAEGMNNALNSLYRVSI
jgi:hypothetical protein